MTNVGAGRRSSARKGQTSGKEFQCEGRIIRLRDSGIHRHVVLDPLVADVTVESTGLFRRDAEHVFVRLKEHGYLLEDA